MEESGTTIDDVLDLMRRNWPEMRPERAGFSIAVQRLTHLLRRYAVSALEPFGLGFSEFELLAALRMQPAPHRLAPSDLYDAMLMSSGGLTKLLKGLEARGLIARSQSDRDRRSLPVELTETGVDVINRAMKAVQDAETPAFDAMNAAWNGGLTPAEALVRLSQAMETAGTVERD